MPERENRVRRSASASNACEGRGAADVVRSAARHRGASARTDRRERAARRDRIRGHRRRGRRSSGRSIATRYWALRGRIAARSRCWGGAVVVGVRSGGGGYRLKAHRQECLCHTCSTDTLVCAVSRTRSALSTVSACPSHVSGSTPDCAAAGRFAGHAGENRRRGAQCGVTS